MKRCNLGLAWRIQSAACSSKRLQGERRGSVGFAVRLVLWCCALNSVQSLAPAEEPVLAAATVSSAAIPVPTQQQPGSAPAGLAPVGQLVPYGAATLPPGRAEPGPTVAGDLLPRSPYPIAVSGAGVPIPATTPWVAATPGSAPALPAAAALPSAVPGAVSAIPTIVPASAGPVVPVSAPPTLISPTGALPYLPPPQAVPPAAAGTDSLPPVEIPPLPAELETGSVTANSVPASGETESQSFWQRVLPWRKRGTPPVKPSEESPVAETAQAPPDGESLAAPVVAAPDAAGSPVAAEELPPGAVLSEDGVVVVPPPKLWTGNFDMGLNGSEGNSRLFNVRFGSQAQRKTPRDILTLKLNYVRTNANSRNTVDRLFFDGREEWPLADSPWTIYVHETTEYDQFRAFDARITGDAGLGYQFIKNDLTTLTGRFGPGVSHEFGGPDNRWVPEAVFGMALSHQLSKYHQLNATVDYFPDVTDFGSYRVNSQASWQILLDEINNLSLKFSVIDRYDSTPNGAQPNDLDYAATLVWSY